MKVVIVAKTRMGLGACIGGLTFDGRSVRLIAPDATTNDHFNLEYAVGDVWEIEGHPPAKIDPPHTENIVVRRKRRLPAIDDLPGFIRQQMPPLSGGAQLLYQGLAQRSPTGALYIAQRTGVPSFSTMFWQPDRPLVRDTGSKRIHYRYNNDEGSCTLTFVGFQEPVEEIPAGSLVRVSLAHWWRPDERPEEELRCYVQLSGWFVPDIQPLAITPITPAKSQPATAALRLVPALDLDDARELLKRTYGYDDFRPLQGEIIDNILQKRDTLAVMPTGSGKSLCYQLPALLFPGLTVVVSPLISLMEDQVLQLRELGIPAAYLNSTLNYDGYRAVMRDIRAGRIKLVYAAPETLLRPETMVLLQDCRVDCFTIDEAHCISEWGHDFRPEYRQLLDVRRQVPDAVCLAVTATATKRVREDIKASLAIPDADEFVAGFDRDNLFLAAEPRIDGLAQTLAFLEAHRGESGIIYCRTRETVDQMAADLIAHGWTARAYHAGLDNKTRLENQRLFAHDRVPIIVATIAFGMGINKSNVRFVLHYDLPKDLESYYQQIGRAGRDGLPADCLLLYSRAEVLTARHFIDQQPPAQQIGSERRLQAMLGFAETSDCRRRPLLTYFGDSPDQDNCGLCDNCLATKDTSNLVDLTEPAQKFLSCVKRTGEIFGVTHITDILRGSRSQKVLSRGHDQLSTYGIGREFSTDDWHYLARQFVQKGLLIQDTEHGSLKLTSRGWAIMRGEKLMGTMPNKHRIAERPAADQAYDTELFERLRAKRRELAEKAGLPPYVLFHDSSLRDMAAYYPQSRSSFIAMNGVGERKAEKYGPEFLAVISAYCREHGLQEIEKTVPTRSHYREPVRSERRRIDEVIEAFNNGLSIEEIANQFDVKQETVIKYLWEAAHVGVPISANEIISQSRLSQADQNRVIQAFDEFGLGRLSPIFEALDGSIGYDEIHLIRLYLFLNDRSRYFISTPPSTIRNAIMDCVSALPGRLPRSGIAKLLIGSPSERVGDFKDHDLYGCLAGTPRFIVMNEIDQMLSEHLLLMDEKRLIHPGS